MNNPETASDPITRPANDATGGVLLVLAHPALERSRANRALARAVKNLSGVTFHDLYEEYPDFVLDVELEQARLVAHDVIALQFPFYWYSMPALLKEWLDLVWLHGFAYGKTGHALRGKRLFVATTTGGGQGLYAPEGGNRFTMEEFLRPLEQTAYLCGMAWEEPFIAHSASICDDAGLAARALAYKARVAALTGVAQVVG
jgi:glutathione-regulated potassium-efflux system ancillary protein KefG